MEKNSCHETSTRATSRTEGDEIATKLTQHPDHAAQKKRLNRVRGQIEGIDRMITERRYCMDIITQIKAAKSALASLEAEIIEAHLRACVKVAFQAKGSVQAEEKIKEIMEFIR